MNQSCRSACNRSSTLDVYKGNRFEGQSLAKDAGEGTDEECTHSPSRVHNSFIIGRDTPARLPEVFDFSQQGAIIFPNWKYRNLKITMTKRPLPAQTRELRQVWDELFSLYPRLRTALPSDLTRAKARLHELHARSDAQPFGDHHIFIFYRIGILLERHAGPMTMRELGAALGVPLSTATRMVDSLVEAGYAKRLPDPEDRRIVRVALTNSGKNLYATFNEFFNRRVEEFLRHFTSQERATMIALMQKGVEVLREITN